MVDIIVGERVVNRAREIGTITDFNDQYIFVAFENRNATLARNAFEQGFLKYENPDLQRRTEESIAQDRLEAERKAEQARLAAQKAKEVRESVTAKKRLPSNKITFEKVTVRLDPVPTALNSTRKGDRPIIQAVFDECDKDTHALYAEFQPEMEYPKYTSQSRSKYCTGFLCKYLDTYVFRVFSRHDIYKKRMRTGVTVMHSDTTEIMRIIYINGKVYHFAKNISVANGYLTHTTAYNKWHCSVMISAVFLNRVVKSCDCGYLNDYIAENEIHCSEYTKLLMPALHNNKVEIVFKHKLYLSTYRIADLAGYLDAFTFKQIDLACKNDVINALPFIKQHGIYDVALLQKLDAVMKCHRYNSSYQNLQFAFRRHRLELSLLDKKLIAFLKKVDDFDEVVYYDYILQLTWIPGVAINDFFDKNYIERHNILAREKADMHTQEEDAEYIAVAKELSWINREDNGYFIQVPKDILSFKHEGDLQHNCVYTNGYYRYVIKRQSIIVFLRQKKNTPYITIEYDYETFAVLQARGRYNTRVGKNIYDYIVNLGKQLRRERLSK